MATRNCPSADPASSPDLLSAVREATSHGNAGRRPRRAFSLQHAGRGEGAVAALLGLYLGYAVVRLPEVFAPLAIPRAPMITMLIFIGILAVAVSPDSWRLIWERSVPLRLVAGLAGLAILTAPLGIWPTGSLDFLFQRYVVAIVIFLSCLVFLRDTRTMRTAVSVFVLSVTIVSTEVLVTFDPLAPRFNEDGDQIDPAIVAERPDLQRLEVVGISLDPNDFGAILATALPLAFWLSVGSVWRRLFWTGSAALMIMAVVPTQSRGSMLGMLAAVTIILGAGARGWRRWLTAILVCVGIAAFAYLATVSGASDRFSDFSGDDYNLGTEGRWYFWRQGFVWMLKRPWGYGISNYPIFFGMLNQHERSAHSTWIQYGMELGLLGLILFMALCHQLVQGLRRLRAAAFVQRQHHPDAERYEVQAGHLLATMAGVLVTGTFLSNAYYPMMYMTLGLAAATLLGSPFATVSPPAPYLAPAPAGSSVRRRRPLPEQSLL